MNTISGSRPVVGPSSVGQLGDLARGVHAGQARHADVQEHDVGVVLLGQRHRLQPVLRLGHDLQLGPDLGRRARSCSRIRRSSSAIRAAGMAGKLHVHEGVSKVSWGPVRKRPEASGGIGRPGDW
jgi:hypothetical protein